ncbi:coq1 putative hexaprenyl diphosphate synthase [Dinochytrium kinnereticum]|nr:coq1 putative hexaprenyl diphosphate synthase [Dinochytrium kinnereticum]
MFRPHLRRIDLSIACRSRCYATTTVSNHKELDHGIMARLIRSVSSIFGGDGGIAAKASAKPSDLNREHVERMRKIPWPEAVSKAEGLVRAKEGPVISPTDLLGSDLTLLTDNIRRLLGSGHPVLTTISSYYFQAKGKHIRPVLVLLISLATSVNRASINTININTPVGASSDIVFESAVESTTSTPERDPTNGSILPSQRRLAEITEMIHTASLLHDDVIDLALTRRSQPSANAEFGNKMAILAGDFLLARASVALARLRNLEVVELLSTVISNLVEGEFMQLRNSQLQEDGKTRVTPFDYYLSKTYMKTASLIAKSCRAAAVLGGSPNEVSEAVYQYGRNLGLAFQLVDDMLDFVSSAETFGKPVNADLKLGLATAPVLFAAQKFPELQPLIDRQFQQPGDVAQALDFVHRSDGVRQTKELATSFCAEAVDALSILPPSPAREALIQLTHSVINRQK